MSKGYGKVGYAELVELEDRPGIWDERIVEHDYFGDLIRNTRRLQTGDKVNSDVNIANEISIVADPYATENFHNMRYVTFMNNKWKVTDARVEYPRLILTAGGLYNGTETKSTD